MPRADVEHDAAHRELGSVLDAAGRHAAARVDELGERLHRVAQAGGPVAGELRPLGAHVDAVGLAPISVARELDARAEVVAARVGLDREARSAARLHGALQRARQIEIRIGGAGREHDRDPLAQLQEAGMAQRAARRRQERRKLGLATGTRHRAGG